MDMMECLGGHKDWQRPGVGRGRQGGYTGKRGVGSGRQQRGGGDREGGNGERETRGQLLGGQQVGGDKHGAKVLGRRRG